MQLIRSHLSTHLIGLEALIDRLLIALLTNGHVLIEGPPGVAKTRTITLFSESLDLQFARIQSTPDLLPSDLTGTDIFDQRNSSFTFMPGPIFNNIILVDEINRAPPKVQSALLEAMGERQVTTNGITRELPPPFLVAATQNPLEHEGTYPLPEAQLDRFMFFVQLALPDPSHEKKILDQVLSEDPVFAPQAKPSLDRLTDGNAIQDARRELPGVFLSEAIKDYIVRLTTATRGYGAGAEHAESIVQAASPRASIFLARAAQAYAWLQGRDHVLPDDVFELAPDIFSGRISLDYRAQAEGQTTRQIVYQLLETTTPA